MVADISTATLREDLLSLFSAKRIDAETWVMNCLVFGLSNKYILTSRLDSDGSSSEIGGMQSTTTVPLVAIDPYPHHVVAAVKLMQQAIDRDFAVGKIGTDAYSNLLSTLNRTLEQLPQCSKSVQTARADFTQSEIPSQEL